MADINMDVSDEKRQAISNMLHVLALNAPNMPTHTLKQITEQLRGAPHPPQSSTFKSSMEKGEFEKSHDAVGARKKQCKEDINDKVNVGGRQDRGKLRPLNAFICFRCMRTTFR